MADSACCLLSCFWVPLVSPAGRPLLAGAQANNFGCCVCFLDASGGGGVVQTVSTESRGGWYRQSVLNLGGGGHVGDRASRVPITPLIKMDVLRCAFLHLDH